jgi:acyl carrier protein
MSQTTLDKITEQIRDLFDEYEGPVTRETSAADIPQWDSLAHVQLIVMVEQATGVRFTTTEIQDFQTLGDMVDTVERKQGPQ